MKQLRMALNVPPVDKGYYEDIGQVIVCWGFLDSNFNRFIQRLINFTSFKIENDWRVRMKFDQRASLYRDLVQLAFAQYPKITEELFDIVAQMEATQLDRNLFAHGTMTTVFPKAGNISLEIEGAYKKKKVSKRYVRRDIQQIASTLMQVGGRFVMLEADNLDETAAPGWSSSELSALMEFCRGGQG